MYPSTIATLTDPLATDRLNAPSHSAIERAQNAEIEAIETFVGTTSSAVGTLIYDVRSSQSNGGGHIQPANLGGTGQTSFTKGDLLVGQSTSVLTRLVAGTDAQILSADSSSPAGVLWIDNPRPKVATNASVFLFQGVETSVMNASIPGSTLGTTNTLIGKTFLNYSDIRSSVIVRGVYGGGVITSVLVPDITGGTGTPQRAGTITHTLTANNNTNSQRSYLEVVMFTQAPNSGNMSSVYSFYDSQVSSINSSAAKNFGATVLQATATVTTNGFVIQKII